MTASLVDLHTHLVPGVDDGAPDLEQALRYAAELADRGIVAVATTPHLPASGIGGPRHAAIRDAFARLEEGCAAAEVELGLHGSYEIRLDEPDVDLDAAEALGPDGHLLVEFPMLALPAYPERMLQAVAECDRRPILAHPERYSGIDRAYGWIARWRELGVLMCVNVGSLWGEYGPEAERVGRRMLAEGQVDLLASDHHARPGRDTDLREAWDRLVEAGQEEVARVLLSDNPGAVLHGGTLRAQPPCELPAGWLGRIRRMMRGGG